MEKIEEADKGGIIVTKTGNSIRVSNVSDTLMEEIIKPTAKEKMQNSFDKSA